MRHKITPEKLREIKQRSTPINYRSLAVNEYGQLKEVKSDWDARIVKGYAAIWGQRNLHGEIFVKGCFAKSLQENGVGSNSEYKIKFLRQHNTDEPLSLFAVLREDDIGLYFETVALDKVPWADNELEQLRSGTINNFSHGFNFIWDRIEWDDATDSIVILEARLFEISTATIPSGMGTYAMRGVRNEEDLEETIEDFINTLPKKNRIEARKIFALQKSLTMDAPPFKAPENSTPVSEARGLDYDYLIKNFSLK